jgi:hypothetical protein
MILAVIRVVTNSATAAVNQGDAPPPVGVALSLLKTRSSFGLCTAFRRLGRDCQPLALYHRSLRMTDGRSFGTQPHAERSATPPLVAINMARLPAVIMNRS